MGIYECRDCAREEYVLRRYRFRFGPYTRCPQCGTYRLVRLKARDHIDPMYRGLWNIVERFAGGRLHHCCYCRIQFYDRRQVAPDPSAVELTNTPVIERHPASRNA